MAAFPIIMPIFTRGSSGANPMDLLWVLPLAFYVCAFIMGFITANVDQTKDGKYNSPLKLIFFTYGIGVLLGYYLTREFESKEKK